MIQPKNNGAVELLSHFRQLNQRISRKQFSISKIHNILFKIGSFTNASSLELNMGYYYIKISPVENSSILSYSIGGNPSTKNYPWSSVTDPIYSNKIYPIYPKFSTW